MSWISVWLTVLKKQVRWAEHCRYRMGAGLAGRGAVWLGGGGAGRKTRMEIDSVCIIHVTRSRYTTHNTNTHVYLHCRPQA